VADALAKLSSLSATAIEHLGPDATAGNKNNQKRPGFRRALISQGSFPKEGLYDMCVGLFRGLVSQTYQCLLC